MPEPSQHILIPGLLLALALTGGCSSETSGLQEGYYTAEAVAYDSRGWKRYMTIYVNQDKIVTVEYNAKNASGFIRSWDMDNMRRMNAESGTYPNKYARAYAVALLNRQDPALIDAVPGAANHLESFQLLAEAALERARKGDKTVIFVQLPDPGRAAIKMGEADLPVPAARPPFTAEPSSGDLAPQSGR